MKKLYHLNVSSSTFTDAQKFLTKLPLINSFKGKRNPVLPASTGEPYWLFSEELPWFINTQLTTYWIALVLNGWAKVVRHNECSGLLFWRMLRGKKKRTKSPLLYHSSCFSSVQVCYWNSGFGWRQGLTWDWGIVSFKTKCLVKLQKTMFQNLPALMSLPA